MTRPVADECAAFYQKYIDEVPDGADILQTLSLQLSEMGTLLSPLDEQRALFRYAPGKWSIKEVVGHMTDAERVFSYRAMCFARKDAGPLPGMDENVYVQSAHFDRRDLSSLLDEYENQRRCNSSLFASLSDDVLMRRGVASGCEFTVRSLVYIIAGHERHHLNVLRERYLQNSAE